MIVKHNLLESAKMIVYFDCWKVHLSSAMLEWSAENFMWLIVIFVPARCTGILQPCDIGLQHVYKHHIKLAAAKYFQAVVQNQLAEGILPTEI